MQKGVIGILVLAVLTTLFLLLNLGHNWSAIFLMLAIIFFGLFGNPMKHVHRELAEKSGKKGRARRRK